MDDDLQKKLTPLRERIDAIDAQVLELLSERARTAQAVGMAKEHHAGAVLRPEREAQVIRRLQDLNGGPLPGQALSAIWTEIMSACRALEQPARVAYLGPQGTYSELAVWRISAMRSIPFRAARSTKSFVRWRPAARISASFRWKTPTKAPSTAPWTCSCPRP